MPATRKPTVYCLIGPTAAGKTDVALHLVERFPFDIVSVDSALVYRHMNIGTAKPSPEILQQAPHRLIDILDPWQTYSAGQFVIDAGLAIRQILDAGRLPLLVGGTLLYFRALQHGLAELPAADPELRREIDARAEGRGWAFLHAELKKVDPATAARLRPNDRQRIQRAIEVFELTGEPLSVLIAQQPEQQAEYDFVRIGLMPSDRPVLHERVEARFLQMLAGGFVAEVENLRAMPQMSGDCPSMRAVGYRQIWAYLDDEYDLSEAGRRAVVATRRLVKRQLTWLRGEPPDLTVDCLAADSAEIIAAELADRVS